MTKATGPEHGGISRWPLDLGKLSTDPFGRISEPFSELKCAIISASMTADRTPCGGSCIVWPQGRARGSMTIHDFVADAVGARAGKRDSRTGTRGIRLGPLNLGAERQAIPVP
jgi:hypothetical protein